MSNNSIVEHRANYYYVEFREEFLIICINCTYRKPVKTGKKSAASPHCKALILAILENWTNNKRGKKEDLAIFMTYKQWSDSMYGMFGRTVIIDSLDELIGEGLISKEPYKMLGNKDTYKYRLNYQELNKRLKLLPERDIHDTHPKMDASKNEPVNPSKNKPDASKTERVTHPKMDAYPSKNGHNIESNITSNIETEKKESPSVVKEPTTSSQPEALSPSLSQNKMIDYPLFDELCRKKGYASDFRVPRNDKNKTAIQDLISQGATPEQVEYVFNDLWDDKDPFWRQHRGKPSTVASQFTARVWKMSQATPKRRTVSGFINYTEDKTAGVPAVKPIEATPVEPTKPKEPSLPVGYTRLKIDKPARARSLQARLQAQKEQL